MESVMIRAIAFFSIILSASAFNITLPPITFCDLTSNRTLSVAHCLEKCVGIYNLNDPVKVILYNSRPPIDFIVARCKKVTKTMKFTKTWTFSTFSTLVSIVEETPDLDGCREAWANDCAKSACVTGQAEIPAEYHWASDTIRSVTYYTIDATLEHTYGFFNGTSYVSTIYGLVPFYKGYTFSPVEEKTLLLWDNKIELISGCHITGGSSITCYYGAHGELYCPGEGITLYKNKVFSSSDCGDTYYFDKGMLFNFLNSSGSPGGIYPMMIASEDEKIDAFSLSTIQAFQTRDALACSTTCMQLPQINNETVFRINSQMFYKRNNVLHYCYQDPTCEINKLVKCGDENKIRITCGHNSYWWRTNFSVSLRSDQCIDPRVGNQELTLDTGGERLEINSSGLFWNQNLQNSVPLFGPVRGSSIIDMSKFSSQSIMIQKLTANSSNPSTITSVIEDFLPLKIVQGITAWIASISHEAKVLMILTLCTILFLMMVWIISKPLIKKERYISESRIISLNSEEKPMLMTYVST